MRRILLTCFGSKIAHEIIKDFEQRKDVEIFVADANPQAPISLITQNFIPLPPGNDPQFIPALLNAVKSNHIEMIIPGGDEDALALMNAVESFRQEGVVAAVQSPELLQFFQSKSNQYHYLADRGFPVPTYQCVKTANEFVQALSKLGYPERPLLMKPNAGRGGRGIFLLSERLAIRNRDGLPVINRDLALQLLDEGKEFILMTYFDGVIYDIDVLRCADSSLYFGQRKRLGTNVTKLFAGNEFEHSAAIDLFCRKLYDVLPTDYLVDYDLMAEENGNIHLLEVNPRPSGSTVSYIPFGVNLYYILAKSYLDNAHIKIPDSLIGKKAHVFYTMIK